MSKYFDIMGRGFKRKYIAAVDIEGELIVLDICKSYEKALGTVMKSIDEFSESYTDDGDIFEIGKLEHGDSDSITIHFQNHSWSEPSEETYYIMTHDKRKQEWDKPRKGTE